MDTHDLANKVVLITGAANGLGRAMALAFARQRCHIVACDINEEALTRLDKALEKEHASHLCQRCDVADSQAVKHLFKATTERFGGLHVLINNAALVPNLAEDQKRRTEHYAYLSTPVPRRSLQFTSHMTDEAWHRCWDVNVHGVFYCMREALKIMEAQGEGRIINIASVAGISAVSAHSPHYSATKGAVIALTKSVAAEVAGANILVNAIAPGGVQTPEFEQYLSSLGEEKSRQLWQLIPIGRLGTLEEYAKVAVFLAGDHYLVGQIISPNGGAVI